MNQQAKRCFGVALSVNPGDLKVLRNMAVCYQSLERNFQALTYFSRALERFPDSAST